MNKQTPEQLSNAFIESEKQIIDANLHGDHHSLGEHQTFDWYQDKHQLQTLQVASGWSRPSGQKHRWSKFHVLWIKFRNFCAHYEYNYPSLHFIFKWSCNWFLNKSYLIMNNMKYFTMYDELISFQSSMCIYKVM